MRKLMTGLAVLALSASALAQTDDEKNTARDFGLQGQQALDRGDARTAEDRFHRAVEIFDNAKAPVPPTLLLGYARGAARNNHFIAADEAYNRIIRAGLAPGAPAPFVKALEEAKREVDAATSHIAHVTITVAGCPSPSVTLDGAPLPSVVLGVRKPVDPGAHDVKATAPGCKDASASFTVGDGKDATTTIALEKEAAPSTTPVTTPTPTTHPAIPATTVTAEPASNSSGSGLRTAGIVTLGVGVAGLIVGAITGGVALGDHDSLLKQCPTQKNCGSTLQGDIDSYDTIGALSTVGFIAGAVLAAAGIVMWVVAPSSKKTEHAAWITPFGVAGRF
ncbi:MAG TPA: hypothetical protein VGH28_16155 [Polyangiaceae bacterium]|jgi:hypothetical protein